MYTSSGFRKSLKYAKSINPDDIFILSAKYGLLNLEDKIEPYEKTLKTMPIKEVREWADSVLNQLKEVSDLNNDEFIFLTGEKYRRFLIPNIKNYEIPMEGLRQGEQNQWLDRNTKI